MPTTVKKVSHVPLEPTEDYVISAERRDYERSRFVAEYGDRVAECMGIKKTEAKMLAWALLDLLQQSVTESDIFQIPSIGVFKKMDKNNIRFYPDRLIQQKYLVATDNGEDGDSVKYLRKKRLAEHHKRIP